MRCCIAVANSLYPHTGAVMKILKSGPVRRSESGRPGRSPGIRGSLTQEYPCRESDHGGGHSPGYSARALQGSDPTEWGGADVFYSPDACDHRQCGGPSTNGIWITLAITIVYGADPPGSKFRFVSYLDRLGPRPSPSSRGAHRGLWDFSCPRCLGGTWTGDVSEKGYGCLCPDPKRDPVPPFREPDPPTGTGFSGTVRSSSLPHVCLS